MTAARSELVDENVTPYYHCISRCVRRAFLCGEGFEHRKDWIENRLEELCSIFSVHCYGYAILDNHLHVLLRLDSAQASAWSDEEVARRWTRLFPLRDNDGEPLKPTDAWIVERAKDAEWVASARKRLCELGWFMKCLKEPLARMANKEDGCTGAFWEGRFKSVAVLDEESLLATCAYIDLNPVAAGIAETPEDSQHTSIRARIDHCRDQNALPRLHDALSGNSGTLTIEQDHWLGPIEDGHAAGCRAGLLSGFDLSRYCRLVDWTSRMVRTGKAIVDEATASMFERLGLKVDRWEATMLQLCTSRKLVGSVMGNEQSLRRVAAMRSCGYVKNRGGRIAIAGD